MLEVNDSLAHQIIRASTERAAHRGAFQTTMHPLNNRPHRALPLFSPAGLLTTIVAGVRTDVARLADLFAPQPVTSQACCPAAS